MKTITIQPDPGNPLAPLPYPFHVEEDGIVQRQDFWRGNVYRVIGFQEIFERHRIDLEWKEVWNKPELAIGKYVVTSDDKGQFSVHQHPISKAEPHEYLV